jgi:hypothetical protein
MLAFGPWIRLHSDEKIGHDTRSTPVIGYQGGHRRCLGLKLKLVHKTL